MNDNQFQNQFPNEPAHCPRCGTPMENGASFCGNCGLRFTRAKAANADVLSVGDYILMMVLFSVPILGLILMLYWSFSSQTAVNRKNFARAYLIFYVISTVLTFVMFGALGALGTTIMESGTASLF